MFRPSIIATLGLLGLAAAFLALASWQWQRAQQKAERQQAFERAPVFKGLPAEPATAEFAHVALHGRFDPLRHLLADNQVLDGRPGVHAYTPFSDSAGRVILVNRGWLPLPPARSPLPAVPTPTGPVTIRGRLGPIPGPGRILGKASATDVDAWPTLVTYPSITWAAEALEQPLYPWVLLLDADSPAGFEGRDWRPVYMTPGKHRGYAFQWLALALLAMACWGVSGVRRARGRDA